MQPLSPSAAVLCRAAGNPAAGRLAGSPNAAENAYYAQTVRWANGGGIMAGYSGGNRKTGHILLPAFTFGSNT